MTDEQDDLTLVYAYGFKRGQESMKAEIKRLRAALWEIVAECRNLGYGNPIVMERMIDRIEEAARAVLVKVKPDDQ